MKTPKTKRASRATIASIGAIPSVKHVLRLFVAGASERSQQALVRVRQICEAELKGDFELTVIDVYQQPKLARDWQIVAIPTLVKEFPRPVRRFIGNFSGMTTILGHSTLGADDNLAV